jgi:hypothetical protein
MAIQIPRGGAFDSILFGTLRLQLPGEVIMVPY